MKNFVFSGMCLLFWLALADVSLAQGGAGFTPSDLQLQKKYWLEKASSGDMEAQYVVGDSYLAGRLGLPSDGEQAVYWLEKAAAQGHLDAQFEAGKLFYFGNHGVTPDGLKAVRWLLAAQPRLAGKNKTLAELLIATCHLTGMGVVKNEVEAVKWFRLAAQSGNTLAAHQLGVCYAEGVGVPADEKEAATWFRKAAQAGDLEAQAQLGLAYRYGRGVPQDFVEAYRWLDRAAARGNTQALESRALLRTLMTPQQLANAQRPVPEPSDPFRFSDVTLKP